LLRQSQWSAQVSRKKSPKPFCGSHQMKPVTLQDLWWMLRVGDNHYQKNMGKFTVIFYLILLTRIINRSKSDLLPAFPCKP
jgi:hypothetical protein